MRRRAIPWTTALLWLVLSAIPVAWLEGVRFVAGAPFTWGGLAARWALLVGLLLLSRWTQPYTERGTTFVWPWAGVAVLGIGVVAALVYVVNGTTWAAWALLAAIFPMFLGLERGLTSGARAAWRWAMRGLLVLLGGAIPVAIGQLESRFSEEEFFVALQVLAMAIFWALLLVAQHIIARNEPAPGRRGCRLDRRWTGLSLFLLTVIGLGVMVRTYQHSFYPSEAPAFEGISAETPFLCGEVPPDPHTYDGEEVFQRLLARVAANPNAGSPEYGMLALGTGEQRWAEAFREALLNEASEGRFANPANTMKWSQYEATLRAYYAPRMHEAFPGLFSEDEWEQLRSWFATINHRALTVEPVDWMYAVAFSKRPEGPYENQENGAGLLALLEDGSLAAPELSPANREYLERSPGGWFSRFRNTDDVYIYELEWIDNAYFQHLYAGGPLGDEVRLSFEWLLHQAPSDGSPLRYNHPAYLSLAGVAYLGARLLADPRYVWLAGRAVEYAEAQGSYLIAQPGAEQPLVQSGLSPIEGSCLLYGDSGLPNQIGPLAPDKISFRDGWTREATNLLLNLRFTGWHRYKATNTITLLHHGTPVAADVLDGAPFRWLPVGRSVFRDKRIPRENLNGLLVERTGMSNVLYHLTGIGGPWAQDPPYYAEVVSFETADERDWSHTRLVDWRGWQHDRWIHFYHDGDLVIVADSAQGPGESQAALMWHLIGQGTQSDQRIQILAGEEPVEVLLWPGDQELRIDVAEEWRGRAGMRVSYQPTDGGHLQVITLFLMGRWAGAEVEFDRDRQLLQISQGDIQTSVQVPFTE